MFLAIYDRYILKKLTKSFFAHLGILFTLFIVLDISVRRSSPSESFFSYYTAVFSLIADRLISIAFLLATVRTLLDCSRHFELMSLQIAGNSILKITRSVLLFAGLLVVANIGNYQFFYPKAAETAGDSLIVSANIRHMILADQSELFYNVTLSSPQQLRDLFLFKSKEEVWHIESLNTFPPYRAKGIDRFSFQNGTMHHLSTHIEDKINLIGAELMPIPRLYSYLSLNELHSLAFRKTKVPLDQIQIFSQLYYKEFMSFLPVLIAMFMIPIATCYHKVIPALKIYVTSLFIFILLYFIMRINIVLAQSELLTPLLMMLYPLALFSLIFYRIRKV